MNHSFNEFFEIVVLLRVVLEGESISTGFIWSINIIHNNDRLLWGCLYELLVTGETTITSNKK